MATEEPHNEIDRESLTARQGLESVEISVIIPAYNELKRLPPTLVAIEAYLKAHFASWEIIVSDDGSTDGSPEMLKEKFESVRFLLAPFNQGKGAAVRRGMMVGRGELLLFSDADLSTPIEELVPMIKAMREGDYDVAIASRDIKGSRLEIRQSWYRELSGKIFNLLVRAISGLPYHDTQCGFKLFTRAAAHAIFAKTLSDRFAFDVEALMLARKLQCKTLEHPVRWINDAEGSKLNFMTDGPKMVMDMIRFRWWFICGRYK